MPKLSVQDFFKRFPTDEACLDHLMRTRFGETLTCPKCKRVGKFSRLNNLPAYSCPWCGHHIHPMQGTPFARTHTPLQKWFYAMYMFTTTRNGVAAKELERALGVTYKTAWRMGHEIRKYMGHIDGNAPLDGHVEVDETYVGGERSGMGKGTGTRMGKTIVMGLVQRGGEAMTQVIPDTRSETLEPVIYKNVVGGSTVNTDSARAYRTLDSIYRHVTLNHGAKEYVREIHHTNTIEGFWSIVKRTIRGTHIHVSAKHLPKYLGEIEYRFNMRYASSAWAMFQRLLMSFAPSRA